MAHLNAANRERLEELAAEMAELGYPITLPPATTVYEVWIVNEDGENIAYVGHYDSRDEGEHEADVDRELAIQQRIAAEQAQMTVGVNEETGEPIPYVSAVNRRGLTVKIIGG